QETPPGPSAPLASVPLFGGKSVRNPPKHRPVMAPPPPPGERTRGPPRTSSRLSARPDGALRTCVDGILPWHVFFISRVLRPLPHVAGHLRERPPRSASPRRARDHRHRHPLECVGGPSR